MTLVWFDYPFNKCFLLSSLLTIDFVEIKPIANVFDPQFET